MNRFIKIGESKELLPDKISEGQTRYYLLDKLLGAKTQESSLTIAYARVSSHDQKKI